MTSDHKEDKQFIKELKHLGLLTNKTPLANHERLAAWHLKGGADRHPSTCSMASCVEQKQLMLTYASN